MHGHTLSVRRGLLAAALTLGLGSAFAQTAFPERAITIVVSDQAGGPGDIISRSLGKLMSDSMKQPVLVENRPGAYGTLGLAGVAKAKPDGYTIGIVFMPHTVSQTLFKRTPYHLQKDFVPLGKVADLFNVLIANKSVPAKTPLELAALAKAKPGQMNYGSGSTGSPAHLSGELFARQAGIQALHVPFKGPVDALTQLVGGQVDYMFLSLPVAMPMIKADKVVPLALTSDRRSPVLPQVPTMVQSGFKDFVMLDWMGFVAPAGTPPEVVARLSAELQKATASPEYRERVGVLGIEAAYAPAAEFGALLGQELAKWRRFIADVGVSLD